MYQPRGQPAATPPARGGVVGWLLALRGGGHPAQFLFWWPKSFSATPRFFSPSLQTVSGSLQAVSPSP